MSRTLDRVIDGHRRKYPGQDRYIIVRSPGRVNLIGEHTDYNGGYVLPAAIDLAIWFVVSRTEEPAWHFQSVDRNESLSLRAEAPARSETQWANYLLGVIDELLRVECVIPGFACTFGGTIPVGAGLSSSAALEAGFAFALNELFSLGVGKRELAHVAHRAENLFVGVRCGVMDQYSSIFGREWNVLRLDCRSLDIRYFPFTRDDVEIILCDTGVRRALASTEYNLRHAQCGEGVRAIQTRYPDILALRDVTVEMLEDCRSECDPVIFQRCGYVVDENARVLAACDALERNDLAEFGRLMFLSHEGLRDLYQVSAPELDMLVEIAARQPGLLGARMMGAGFGGCTINLVERDRSESFRSRLKEEYCRRSGRKAEIHVARLSGGTNLLFDAYE